MCLLLPDLLAIRLHFFMAHRHALMNVLNVPKHTDSQTLPVIWDRRDVCMCVSVCVWMDRFDKGNAECGALQTLSRDLLMVALPA